MSGASPNPEFADALIALLPRLRRYARVLTGERFAADDLVQDTLERAWARHRQWQRGSDLRAWLFSIMHNRRVDVARGERFVATEVEIDADTRAAATDALADGPIDALDLQRAFTRLSIEHREVLILVAVEQLSYAEAAAALTVPIGTVMSRLSRARACLRDALEAPVGAPRAPADHQDTPRLTRIK